MKIPQQQISRINALNQCFADYVSPAVSEYEHNDVSAYHRDRRTNENNSNMNARSIAFAECILVFTINCTFKSIKSHPFVISDENERNLKLTIKSKSSAFQDNNNNKTQSHNLS